MIRKAIIPLAGAATRMVPWTRVLPKALLPLPYGQRVLPVLHHICLEADSAGVEEILLVVSPRDREMIARYVALMPGESSGPVSAHVEIIEQPRPAGFGDAVLRGEGFVGSEPFLLFLGDHVYRSEDPARSCARQVVSAWERCPGAAMIGVQPVPEEGLSLVGAYRGELLEKRIYAAREFIEKPDRTQARERLVTPGLQMGTYLAHCGIYFLTEDIFAGLKSVAREKPEAAELSLAEAQQKLLAARPEEYRLCGIAGRGYDTGTPQTYALALAAFTT